MSARNFKILQWNFSRTGSSKFLWAEARISYRCGEEMTAVLDFDERGHVFRIEILYLNHELSNLERRANMQPATNEDDVILQMSDASPASFLIWPLGLKPSSHSHVTGSSWILCDDAGVPIGVEVIVMQ